MIDTVHGSTGADTFTAAGQGRLSLRRRAGPRRADRRRQLHRRRHSGLHRNRRQPPHLDGEPANSRQLDRKCRSAGALPIRTWRNSATARSSTSPPSIFPGFRTHGHDHARSRRRCFRCSPRFPARAAPMARSPQASPRELAGMSAPRLTPRPRSRARAETALPSTAGSRWDLAGLDGANRCPGLRLARQRPSHLHPCPSALCIEVKAQK